MSPLFHRKQQTLSDNALPNHPERSLPLGPEKPMHYGSSLINRQRLLTAALTLSLVIFSTVNAILKHQQTPHYRSRQEADFRPHRFPSVEQRVRAYMSNWYLPPCSLEDKVRYQWHDEESVQSKQRDSLWRSWWSRPSTQRQGYYKIGESTTAANGRTLKVTTDIKIGRVFVGNPDNLKDCFEQSWSIRYYCSDSIDSIISNRNQLSMSWRQSTPLLLQFGDETESIVQDMHNSFQVNPRIPHIKKIRLAMSREELDRVTISSGDPPQACHHGHSQPIPHTMQGSHELQPIIWNLNVERHYGYLKLVKRLDRPWDNKLDAAVFRGVLTGGQSYNPNATDDENCQALDRCLLVYQYANSPLINAKLTSTMERMPGILHGVNLTGNFYWREELLAYKGLIVLEGNDVSSSLKWAMLSQSVVLMPPPRFASYALEDWLEPWVHYIPLDPSLNDVPDKVQWMIDHSVQVQRISYRATLWIMDLVYHPDAARDEQFVYQEILRRYQAHFAPIDED